MKKLFILFLFGLFSLNSFAKPVEYAKNLVLDADLSQQQKKPIVFFITASDCPYCELLREAEFQFLTDDKRFILREIELDSDYEAIDFDGQKRSHGELADRYDISLTPTVVFVGADGEQLTDSIVGVTTLDFYAFYFNKAVKKATDALTKLD